MKYLKSLVLIFSFIAFNVYAGTNSFDQIVFFGDSLSDNGNLYNLDFKTLPVSPPYFDGRFSNGPTWAEDMAKALAGSDKIDAQNYAVGGETTNHIGDGVLDFDLDMSINEYYLKNILSDKSHTLFVFWIGANDYLSGDLSNIDKITSDTVNKIQSTIEDLIGDGAKYFMIVNLPDIGKAPVIISSGNSAIITKAVIAHNEKLKTAVEQLQNDNPGVKFGLYDVNAFFTDVVSNVDTYNKKYGTHMSNLTESCWLGGYQLKSPMNIMHQLAKNYPANAPKNADFNAMAEAITHNKQLSVAYAVSQSYDDGKTPCADPDAYLFWDGIHPTRIMHQILGDNALNYVNSTFPR